MKKRYFWTIITIIFVILVSLPIYLVMMPNKLGEIYLQYYDVIESNLVTIEDNMDEIATKDWESLKAIETNDKKLKETYNSLVSDIKNCYLLMNSKNKKTILDYKEKRNISEKELNKLAEAENCLENFDKYQEKTLSDNKQLSNRLKGQIKVILNYEDFNEPTEFSDIVYNEAKKINIIANLTSWLKIEYNTYKLD